MFELILRSLNLWDCIILSSVWNIGEIFSKPLVRELECDNKKVIFNEKKQFALHFVLLSRRNNCDNKVFSFQQDNSKTFEKQTVPDFLYLSTYMCIAKQVLQKMMMTRMMKRPLLRRRRRKRLQKKVLMGRKKRRKKTRSPNQKVSSVHMYFKLL